MSDEDGGHIFSFGKDAISQEKDDLQEELDQMRAGLELYSAIDPTKVKAAAVRKVEQLAAARKNVKGPDGQPMRARDWLKQYRAGVRIQEIRARQKELSKLSSSTTRFQEELEEIEDDEAEE